MKSIVGTITGRLNMGSILSEGVPYSLIMYSQKKGWEEKMPSLDQQAVLPMFLSSLSGAVLYYGAS